MTERNSYGLAIAGLAVSALVTAIYVTASYYIPIMILGTLLPLGATLIVLFASQWILKGRRGFRMGTCLAAIVLTVFVNWYTYLALVAGTDFASAALFAGPAAFVGTIGGLASQVSYDFFSDAKDLVTDSGLRITGGALIALWIAEALLFVGAAVMGYRMASEEQQTASHGQLAEMSDTMRSDGLPVLGGLVVGLVKGVLPLVVIFGGLYLASEVFDLL